ncbi:glycosyltransferase involved in cell wall biosynthesis [Bacillus sp. SLBN-46]|uniref:glycosyltransferase family 2 protein n=1 Tax=Bacillus sp. SLBN-46 TaxID=3042283 RepID=UPI00285E0F99|nr:glycosyltransferase family 2 protein [Bacillus sp. SLBN-46]MDR6121164.1 glycosyltransferase involved in cell wall biosynthesis [Bacillus sp. SLBN-46]
MDDLISVIVPVYNVEKYLPRCLDSIIYQKHKHLQIILVNDGSSDLSGKICDEYAKRDSRITVIHQKNSGVSNARNNGLLYAKGKYVQFIDGDDYIEKDMCSRLYEAMSDNCDLVICGYRIIQDGISKSRMHDNHINTTKDWYRDFILMYENALLHSPCNKLYIKKKIKVNFRQDISLGEDLIFNLDYIRSIENIICIPDVLYSYIKYMPINKKLSSLASKYREDFLEIQLVLHEEVENYIKFAFPNNSEIINYEKFHLISCCFSSISKTVYSSGVSAIKKINSIKQWSENKEIQKCINTTRTSNFFENISTFQRVQFKLFRYFLKQKLCITIYLSLRAKYILYEKIINEILLKRNKIAN